MGRTTRSANPLRCDLRTLVERQYGQAASRQIFTSDTLLPSYPANLQPTIVSPNTLRLLRRRLRQTPAPIE